MLLGKYSKNTGKGVALLEVKGSSQFLIAPPIENDDFCFISK